MKTPSHDEAANTGPYRESSFKKTVKLIDLAKETYSLNKNRVLIEFDNKLQDLFKRSCKMLSDSIKKASEDGKNSLILDFSSIYDGDLFIRARFRKPLVKMLRKTFKREGFKVNNWLWFFMNPNIIAIYW